MSVRVKICGLAREEDARQAASLGADFLGLVLAQSPRGVIPAQVSSWVGALRAEFPKPAWVGVFVRPTPEEMINAAEELGLDYLQVHGMPAEWAPPALPRPWIRVLRPASAGRVVSPEQEPFATLIDTPRADGYGGTGEVFDWDQLPALPPGKRFFLAGGLDADNVVDAITRVRPWGVDASSRLESQPGRKDPARVQAFVEAVRGVRVNEEGSRP